MPDTIPIGLLTHAGGAHIGAYLQALAASDECGQVFLADPDGRWEVDAKRLLGSKLKGIHADPRELLEARKPAMALVSMEARLAPPVIDAALDAGCHVFAEKPACVAPDDFRPLVQKADSKHLHLMLALANRLNPEVAAARQLIAEGRIGKLYAAQLHLVADQTRLTRPAYHQQWFADRERAGGGHLIWLGIHWLDLAMYLVGESIEEVAGFTGNIGGQPIRIEDSAAAAFRFAQGALGTVTSGYFLDRGYHSHIKIWGSAGWVHLQQRQPEPLKWYSTAGDEAGREQVWSGTTDPRGYTPFVAAAIRACAQDTAPPISNGDSLRALETVFAIYEAAARGNTTQVRLA